MTSEIGTPNPIFDILNCNECVFDLLFLCISQSFLSVKSISFEPYQAFLFTLMGWVFPPFPGSEADQISHLFQSLWSVLQISLTDLCFNQVKHAGRPVWDYLHQNNWSHARNTSLKIITERAENARYTVYLCVSVQKIISPSICADKTTTTDKGSTLKV